MMNHFIRRSNTTLRESSYSTGMVYGIEFVATIRSRWTGCTPLWGGKAAILAACLLVATTAVHAQSLEQLEEQAFRTAVDRAAESVVQLR
ncbi:MAG: hypothetical protein ACR2NU_10495, partial [Aeoliella sp.]